MCAAYFYFVSLYLYWYKNVGGSKHRIRKLSVLLAQPLLFLKENQGSFRLVHAGIMRQHTELSLCLIFICTWFCSFWIGCNGFVDLDEVENDNQPPPSALCAEYCDLAEENCIGKGITGFYANREQCLDQCTLLPAGGLRDDVSGDTLLCRIYHLGVPAQQDPAMHCPHGNLDSGDNVCGGQPPCVEYCEIADANCGGIAIGFANMEDCLNQCAGFMRGIPDTTNTAQCRAGFARMAASQTGEERDMLCANAAIARTVCSTNPVMMEPDAGEPDAGEPEMMTE